MIIIENALNFNYNSGLVMAEEYKITRNMTIAEALKVKPQVAGILMTKGMHCLGCVIAQGETLEQAAEVHGLDVEELLKELNA